MDHESVLVVSGSRTRAPTLPFQFDADTFLPEDLAMMEASYGIARIIQAFPDIRLPPNDV